MSLRPENRACQARRSRYSGKRNARKTGRHETRKEQPPSAGRRPGTVDAPRGGAMRDKAAIRITPETKPSRARALDGTRRTKPGAIAGAGSPSESRGVHPRQTEQGSVRRRTPGLTKRGKQLRDFLAGLAARPRHKSSRNAINSEGFEAFLERAAISTGYEI